MACLIRKFNTLSLNQDEESIQDAFIKLITSDSNPKFKHTE
jgi:hypothetical protein